MDLTTESPRNTQGRGKKCKQNFGKNTLMKDTTWKTRAEIRG
jgi:hypothetical protein